nr:PRTRC system protein C [uncultured Massilia sp.]
MDIQKLTREFRYNGVALADPGQALSLPQVRDFYANVYPEITSADIEGPEQLGGKQIYTFRRAVGTKGASLRDAALQRLRAGGRLAVGERPEHVLTSTDIGTPVSVQLNSILNPRRSTPGVRCLAPAINHAVLP